VLYLTSLRGIAACIVMVFHLGFYFKESTTQPVLQWIFSYGYLGVDFFFILSGFILTHNYKRIFEKELKVSDLSAFFIKRFARIYPLHLFILLCFLLIPLAHIVTDRSFNQSMYGFDALSAKLFLVDLWFIGYPFWESWNTPSWTISGEVFAYLAFPFICLSFHFNKYLSLIFFCLSIVIIALSYSLLESASIGDNISKLGLLRCFFEFICGACICEFHNKLNKVKKIKWDVVFVSVCVLLICATYVTEKNYIYIPFLFSLLLLAIINFRGYIHTFLENKYLIILGEISYSVYLSHIFILHIYRMFFVSEANPLDFIDAITYMFITIVFSYFTYKYVEGPMRKKISSRYCH
jgi:peptidoglycan/LPS O-acetylase OafA/YrhL